MKVMQAQRKSAEEILHLFNEKDIDDGWSFAGFNSTLTPKNQNFPIFGHFSPVISDVPTTFFPISSTRGGTAIPAALNPK